MQYSLQLFHETNFSIGILTSQEFQDNCFRKQFFKGTSMLVFSVNLRRTLAICIMTLDV